MSRCLTMVLSRCLVQASNFKSSIPKVTYKTRTLFEFTLPHHRIKEIEFQETGARKISTSSQRKAIPPIVLLVLRPIAKVSAMVFGRVMRKWWQKLPANEREKILSRLRTRQTHISFGVTVFFGLVFIYYLEHVEEEPITKRKRFILYNDDQMDTIAQMEFESQISLFQTEIVPTTHPIYNRVVRVANRILQANNSMPQVKKQKWAVTVIDRPDITNAFVLPNGKIVLFTGILNVATNDDQLAIVLSHEIAHNLLSHQAENLSKVFLLEMLLLIPLVMFWALMPDAGALFSQWLSSRLADIMISLPFSRAIEKEADVVGLELAAKACFDVREAPVFWGKMSKVSEMPEPVEWLSTHPSNKTRQFELSHLVPAALGIRESCQCPKLPPISIAQRFFFQNEK